MLRGYWTEPGSRQSRWQQTAAVWKILPKAAALFCAGKIKVENGIAKVYE